MPAAVRQNLVDDYQQLEEMLAKLDRGQIHIAALGRVGVGKSSVLNALLGEERFSVSPLHGETRKREAADWPSYEAGGVYLVDTPGLDEIDGEEREKLATEAARRADLVLFVVDSDLSEVEREALVAIVVRRMPVLLVLNKADRYTGSELAELHAALCGHVADLLPAENVIAATARPRPQTVVLVGDDGEEKERQRARPSDVSRLRVRLWEILDKEGKSLAALNASLFAGAFSEQLGLRIIEARRHLGEKVIGTYSLAKGVAVALNPVPVADLFAVALMDVGLVVHLSRLYGLPLTRSEASSLIGVIATQMVAVTGTVWAIHLISSALKLGTGGLSTLVTAGAQGAVAYYSTYVVGRVAQQYLAQGKAWGEGGPKAVVKTILDSIDRESLIAQASDQIRARLKEK